MNLNTVTYEVSDGVAWLTLNRPERGNAVSAALAAAVAEVCHRVNQYKDARVLVICGAGEAFCVGSEDDASPMTEALAGVTCPLIAAINGDAAGQGLEIALVADIRLAVATAKFWLPQITGGRLPGDGGSQRLPRLVGQAKALELLLTGDTIDAAEALRIGLVSRVHAAPDFMPAVRTLAAGISQRAPVSLRFTREAVSQGLDMTLAQGLRLEADLYSLLQTTADRTEGITAFLKKRLPDFKGE